MAPIFKPEEIPESSSWIYDLTSVTAIEQCAVLGIEPRRTLEENRALLRAYINNLRPNSAPVTSAPPTLPTEHPPLMAADKDKNLNTLEDQKGPLTQQDSINQQETVVTTGNLVTTHQVTLPSSTSGPSQGLLGLQGVCTRCCTTQALPNNPITFPTAAETWAPTIQYAAAAIGASIANALATQGSENSRTTATPKATLAPMVADLITRLPVVNGNNTTKLMEFLVEVNKITRLRVAGQQAVILHCLPRTSGQLRSLWTQAIEEGISLDTLQHRILNFFVPRRLRQATISEMVYRSQRPSEPLAEFATSVQDVASVLAPELQEQDILEILVTGMNPATRARMGGFPPPATITELMALIPNLEVVRRLEAASAEPVPANPRGTGAESRVWPRAGNNRPRLDRPFSGQGGGQRWTPSAFRAPFSSNAYSASPPSFGPRPPRHASPYPPLDRRPEVGKGKARHALVTDFPHHNRETHVGVSARPSLPPAYSGRRAEGKAVRDAGANRVACHTT